MALGVCYIAVTNCHPILYVTLGNYTPQINFAFIPNYSITGMHCLLALAYRMLLISVWKSVYMEVIFHTSIYYCLKFCSTTPLDLAKTIVSYYKGYFYG
jgi:hypothetical protein